MVNSSHNDDLGNNLDFDAFVSYFEETDRDYAETIKRNLERFGIRTFVAHLEKRKYSGNFRDKIDGAISKCKYFILLVTIDTLDRIEFNVEISLKYVNS